MIRPVLVDKQSPFLAEECALCKGPFAPGDEIVICPEDAARHHLHCWRTNHNKCSAYGCRGQGEVLEAGLQPTRRRVLEAPAHEWGRRGRPSKVRTLPSSSFGCTRTCLFLGIVTAVLLFAISCFGLWAIADYIMIHVLDIPYRPPLSDLISGIAGLVYLALSRPFLPGIG